MTKYDLRLYKRNASPKMLHELLEARSFEAANDDQAIQLAKEAQVDYFVDNSDLAILFDQHGKEVWSIAV